MDKIRIDDSKNLIQFACEDLEALQSVVEDSVDRKDDTNEKSLLIVTARALDPIIRDIKSAIEDIETALVDS